MKYLYHLSYQKRNKIFTPKIPKRLFEDGKGNVIEDNKQKRICTSLSIKGCLRAMYTMEKFLSPGDSYYVHRFDATNLKIKKPTKEEVPDCDITKETWIIESCISEVIGEIKIINKKYKWKWIQHFSH